MNKKIIAVSVTAILAAMMLVPTTGASGTLARTFPDAAPSGLVTWKDAVGGEVGGVGWYDPFAEENLCIVSLFGLSTPGGAGFYYETLRMYTNINKHVFELGQDAFVPVPCPFAVPSPPDQNQVGSSNFNVGVSQTIGLSVLICLDSVFGECEVDAGTADWDLLACKADADSGAELVPGVTEKPLPVSFTAGDLLFETTGLAALENQLPMGSSAIACDGDGDGTSNEPEDFGHWHDVTGCLNPETELTDDFACVHTDQILHVGHGDAYIISAWRANVTDTAGFKNGGASTAVCSHDWFLGLDRGSTDQWVTDVADHLLGGPLQGIYDLSGDNGCMPDVDCDVEDKNKGDPLPPKPEKDEDCSIGDFKKDNEDIKGA